MELTINELKELTLKDSDFSVYGRDHGWSIVIADRGHVWVGEVVTDGDWCWIRNGSNVRRWGTTHGLGELATKGPQTNTVLDAVPEVRLALRALIAVIPCEAAAWKR